ncbi:MAG TPA: tetratricopeptide repeat protein [Streptosporangiaceae bacterium]
MVVLSREAFDEIEFDAASSGDHRTAAREMMRLADTGMQTAGMPRSEAYVRAGEQWLLADEPAAAVNGFERALADGGPSSVDPRVPLARALYALGRTDEADTLIRQLGTEPPRDARMCDLMAEVLVERSDLVGALAWATAGVEMCLGRSPGPIATAGAVPAPTTEPSVVPVRDAGPVPPAERGSAPPTSQSGTSGAEGTGSASAPREFVVPPSADGRLSAAQADETELRLLLSLRFRIRNDLGLPEDDYDRLLDRLPSKPGHSRWTS